MLKRIFVPYFLLVALSFGCKDESSNEGDVLFKQGKFEEAVKAYDEYLKLKPSHVKTIYNRGRAYEELKEYDKALEDFYLVLQEDPQNVSALLSIGKDFFYRKEDYKNAYFNFDKALKYDNNNETAYTLRGKANQKLGNIQEAMSDYNNAIRINKEYGDAYLSRGSLKIYYNQKHTACNDFKMAKSLGMKAADKAISVYCP